MKQSEAHIRATTKWEKNNYSKTLVRFRKSDEDAIREAAGDSLNGFIVKAVLAAVEEYKNAKAANDSSEA